MRLILVLVVVAVVGWLAVTSLRSQTDATGDVARRMGVDVPQDATPRQQVEAIGQAVEKMQAQHAEQQRQLLEDATRGTAARRE